MTLRDDSFVRSEVRDGMRVIWNAPVPMADGIVLRADVFSPIDQSKKYPVIISHGVYAKGLTYQDGYPMQWEKMISDYPEILIGSSNKYQAWEVTDPERWVPHDYVVVRVDSRGAGWSEGVLDPMSPLEAEDFCQSIEWAGSQPWSNGSVGVLGISYYSHMAWLAAERAPNALKAIIPWEGFVDLYRDATYHGGILSEFAKRWASIQAVTVQYGLGNRAKKNPHTNESIAGPVNLTDEELSKNRRDLYEQSVLQPFDSDWWQSRSADPRKIKIPFLSCANWGGMGIHPRGNFSGFTESPAQHKWLEVHGDTHWSLFSSNYGLDLQKRFFDYFLKGIENGWLDTPPVLLKIRHVDGSFEDRTEKEWPIARTQWVPQFLNAESKSIATENLQEPSTISYESSGEGVVFRSKPLLNQVEITGPIVAKLFIESASEDADLFLTVLIFDPNGKEVTFQGALDPNTPPAMGWLRASHRKLDVGKSKSWQPVHLHIDSEPLKPGQIVELDIEILPTSLVLPVGWTIGLSVRGKDYEYAGHVDDFGQQFYYATRGTGGMTHNEIRNRSPEKFNSKVTLHTGGQTPSCLILPIIPSPT